MPSILSPVLLLLMLSLLNQRSWAQNTAVGPFLTSGNDLVWFSDTARCYSCMSKLYEAVWPSLSHIYKKPRNFTDDCNDDRIAEGRVPIVHCPTICVSLFEQPNIAGVRIKGYIRGCMSDVLISGFNQTIVTWYRWMHRDSCRPYRKKELFKLGGESADDSTIDVCTCYADHCNGNSASLTSPFSIASFLVFSWLFLIG
ncbi:hypothetical protein B9Z55_020501 [Caenorhabditis nigoni]|uniref:Uncharacterized protein n=2 Tax=Caenorhabditis nigoni TaxID=1611254 RepID=A0A2G5TMZ3_9PELO|nr:hypothetical protein B9Z55_020501 [Caenorhabditis nigoni]